MLYALMGPKRTGFLYISKDASSSIQPVQRENGVRFVASSTGIGSLPLVIGLGAAVEAMRKRGMTTVEKRIIELRDRGLCRSPQTLKNSSGQSAARAAHDGACGVQAS